jgi:hypothetical protein
MSMKFIGWYANFIVIVHRLYSILEMGLSMGMGEEGLYLLKVNCGGGASR